jgi:hypothetical protein
MKFLIAGLGSIGRRHFRNLIALGERDLIYCARIKGHCLTMSWQVILLKRINQRLENISLMR